MFKRAGGMPESLVIGQYKVNLDRKLAEGALPAAQVARHGAQAGSPWCTLPQIRLALSLR